MESVIFFVHVASPFSWASEDTPAGCRTPPTYMSMKLSNVCISNVKIHIACVPVNGISCRQFQSSAASVALQHYYRYCTPASSSQANIYALHWELLERVGAWKFEQMILNVSSTEQAGEQSSAEQQVVPKIDAPHQLILEGFEFQCRSLVGLELL
jgi:hypothetical protein